MEQEGPIYVKLTGAQVHDSVPVSEAIVALENYDIKKFVADRGYDDDKIRDALKTQGIIPVIPSRKNRKEPASYDKTIYNWRWRVEALFGKIKENRRLCMRFDKLDDTFLGFLALSFIKGLVC